MALTIRYPQDSTQVRGFFVAQGDTSLLHHCVNSVLIRLSDHQIFVPKLRIGRDNYWAHIYRDIPDGNYLLHCVASKDGCQETQSLRITVNNTGYVSIHYPQSDSSVNRSFTAYLSTDSAVTSADMIDKDGNSHPGSLSEMGPGSWTATFNNLPTGPDVNPYEFKAVDDDGPTTRSNIMVI